MRANEAFPSKYLKSADVKERPCVAVIKHLTQKWSDKDRMQKKSTSSTSRTKSQWC